MTIGPTSITDRGFSFVMKIAIMSDIHGNLEALTCVLQDIKEQGCQLTYCLGDVVGYGPNPKECLLAMQQFGIPVVKGNHDEASSTDGPLDDYTFWAVDALNWTRDKLQPEHKQWLEQLPFHLELPQFDATLYHANGHNPGRWDYIEKGFDAIRTLFTQNTQFSFVGHTHVAKLIILNADGQIRDLPPGNLTAVAGQKYCVNVGSVGQPRDGDARSSYVIYEPDARSIVYRRVTYPIEQTQSKMIKEGLPGLLAARLALGY